MPKGLPQLAPRDLEPNGTSPLGLEHQDRHSPQPNPLPLDHPQPRPRGASATSTSPRHLLTSRVEPVPYLLRNVPGAVSGSSSFVLRSAGGRTFPDRLRRLAPLNSVSQSGHRPPAALERPCSHADPNRLNPPGHPRCIRCCDASGLAVPAAKTQVVVSKAILRSRNTATPPQRRWAAARPLPTPPSETGGTRGEPAQGAAFGRG